MKTLSALPLLVLFAAFPVAAQDAGRDPAPPAGPVGPAPTSDPATPPAAAPAAAPHERCKTAFLEDVVKRFTGIGSFVGDGRIGKANRTMSSGLQAGEMYEVGVLTFGDFRLCDAGTWRHLASGGAPDWRNAEAKKYWDAGSAKQQAALLLIADDFFKAFDPKALAVLTAADKVIEAGVRLGIVATSDSDKSLSETLPGAVGGPFIALKPKTVRFTLEGEHTASVSPEQLGPTLRLLVDERDESNGGGKAVMSFRLAVLALHAELFRLGVSDAAVIKRLGAALPGVHDFTPGLPNSRAFYRVEEAVARDDAKFRRVVAALTGEGPTPALDDAAPRADALLESVDLGVRNLVAIRAQEVNEIVAVAKARLLKDKTISQLEVSARAAAAVKDMPTNSLPAAVLQRLAETPEYARLDALYENRKRGPGGDSWVSSPQGQAMAAERDTLKAAALSAGIETVDGRKAIVFTQGGKKTVLGSIVPESVEGDPSARANTAAVISNFITEGALGDAKYQAVVAAIRGGRPVRPILKPAEIAVAKDVPPGTKKITEGAAGCENPKDLIRNDYETYAARQRAAAAAMAGANVRSRKDVEKERLKALATSEVACKKKKAAAAAIRGDYFDDTQAKAVAKVDAECKADIKAINDAAEAKIAALAAQEAGDRDPGKLRAQADADLAVGFGVAIVGSIATLRHDYTTAGSPRLRRLSRVTGDSPRLTTFTASWFAQEWPQDVAGRPKLKAAIDACASALGFGGKKISYHNPENPGNVDNYCKVNEQLTAYIVGLKGSTKLVP